MAEKDDKKEAAPLDAAGIQKAVADAVAAAMKPVNDAVASITLNQKVIADTMAADKKAKDDAAAAEAKAQAGAQAGDKKDAAAKPMTAEEISKQIADSVAAALQARDAAQQSTAERAKFLGEKLKDVPDVYHGRLGNDPAKWAAEEQSIRDGLKADLAKLGVATKDVGGGNAGGASTGDATATAQQAKSHRVAQYKAAGLSDGEADFASSMKLPA